MAVVIDSSLSVQGKLTLGLTSLSIPLNVSGSVTCSSIEVTTYVTSIQGDMTVTSTATLGGLKNESSGDDLVIKGEQLTVGGSVTANQADFTVTGKTSFQTLKLSGSTTLATINDNMKVKRETTVLGAITINGDLHVKGTSGSIKFESLRHTNYHAPLPVYCSNGLLYVVDPNQ